MPSTTPNYGWSYPISSDDLNAGASTIGSFATSADATVKNIDNIVTWGLADRYTKAVIDAAFATRDAAIAARPTSNASSITVGGYTVTTDAAGRFSLAGIDARAAVGMVQGTLFQFTLQAEGGTSTKFICMRNGNTENNSIIKVMVIAWA